MRTATVTEPVQKSTKRLTFRTATIRTTLIASLTAGSLVLGSGGAWASPKTITPEDIPSQSDSQAAANASEIATEVDSLPEEEQAELIEDIDAQSEEAVDSQSSPPPSVDTQAVPVVLIVTCVGSIGLSAYQGYKGGDPVEFIASAILGCVPAGAAAKPAIIKVIKANKGAIIKALKAVGVSGALITALEGDSAN